MHTRRKGEIGEKIALKYLLKNGYKIKKKNYYTRYGEIDLIVWDKTDKELVFVEVKSRASNKFGQPEDAVDNIKINRIMNSADCYLNEINYQEKYRFDCLALKINYDKRLAKITHFKNIN